jgi:hypothetical protein
LKIDLHSEIMGKIGLILFMVFINGSSCEQESNQIKVNIDWNRTVAVSKSYATLQAIPNPSHQPGSPLREPLWNSLRNLRANYVRYSPWGIYPELEIAEPERPTNQKTSWDFSSLDPVFDDFMNAMEGRPVVMNYQAIPGWMMKKPRPEKLTHEMGSLFTDPTGKELAAYFARIVSWYTKGGFTDELGKWHESGHNYTIGIWEIMNEPDHESIAMTKELYTALYDAVAEEIMKVQPEMQFMGLSMSSLHLAPEWTEYFLDPKNHKPGIPLNFVSYHLYATLPGNNNDHELYPMNVFRQADAHLNTIRITDSIRQKLSPGTRIDINESGILFRNPPHGWGRMDGDSFHNSFWNLSAAYYAYIYAGLALQGIDIVGESTLWSDPKDWPEVSLLNWKDGKPNARYWVLNLINENFGPGDKLVETDVIGDAGANAVFACGFVTTEGARKILLVNKSGTDQHLRISQLKSGNIEYVDQTTGFDPPSYSELNGSSFLLGGLGVAIVTWKFPNPNL